MQGSKKFASLNVILGLFKKLRNEAAYLHFSTFSHRGRQRYARRDNFERGPPSWFMSAYHCHYVFKNLDHLATSVAQQLYYGYWITSIPDRTK